MAWDTAVPLRGKRRSRHVGESCTEYEAFRRWATCGTDGGAPVHHRVTLVQHKGIAIFVLLENVPSGNLDGDYRALDGWWQTDKVYSTVPSQIYTVNRPRDCGVSYKVQHVLQVNL